MKIFEIIPQLEQGGAERFVVDLCNELVKRHDVTLVVLHNLGKYGLFARDVDKRVRIICLDKRLGFDWRLMFKLRKLIKKEEPDIVHTHLRSIVYASLSALTLPKVKFFHTIHSDAQKEAAEFISRWCRKIAFGLKKVVPITISEESKRSFTEFYKLESELIVNGRPDYKIPRGENLSKVRTELQIKNGKTVIVNIARLHLAKNQPTLVRAIDNLNNKGYDLKLFIIGDTHEKTIREEIMSIGSRNMHLLGTKMNPRDYMAEADAFCLSSIYEGMPITLIECFSVGAIPICTPVGGIVNLIQDGKNGILASGTSQKDIEDAIIRFLQMSETEKQEMKKRSRESFKDYDMQTCGERYERLFYKSIERK